MGGDKGKATCGILPWTWCGTAAVDSRRRMWSGVHEASKASRGEAAYKRFPPAENLGTGGLCPADQS